MLSLTELRRAAGALDSRLAGSRLERVAQVDDVDLILSLRRPGGSAAESGKCHVLLSCSPEFARLSVIKDPPQAPQTPPPFTQYLRAHLGRAGFGGIRVLGEDRLASVRLHSKEGEFQLLLSILGPRSNIYLLDAAGILLFSMRPLEETRRELARGQVWVDPHSALKSAGIDRWGDCPDGTYLETIEDAYRQLAQRKKIENLSRKISQALNREADALGRKAANMQEDLAEAIEAERYKHRGELLKSVLHKVNPGDNRVVAADFETGEEVEIPLDPQLSAAENLERYFSRYHKELRGVSIIRQQLEAVQTARAEIDNLQEELRGLLPSGDVQAIESFASRTRVKKLLGRRQASPRAVPRDAPRIAGKRDVPSRLLPKRYKSADGLEIWVGRSDEGNDYLTTRLAHGNDLFFHLEGSPGSHVILRTESSKDPPPESLLDACELAVHFSKHKEARRADVHVAPIKYVRKPPRAKPGLVYVTSGKTIHLRRDPARLERVLASRLDE